MHSGSTEMTKKGMLASNAGGYFFQKKDVVHQSVSVCINIKVKVYLVVAVYIVKYQGLE